MLEWEDDVDPTDFDGQEVPDVALDPQTHTVTFCNVSDSFRVAYVTIYETTVRGASGKTLSSGIAVDNEGNQRSCLTFIVLCPRRTFAHFCSLDLPEGKTIADVESIAMCKIGTNIPIPMMNMLSISAFLWTLDRFYARKEKVDT
jgi:hypothetical protein